MCLCRRINYASSLVGLVRGRTANYASFDAQLATQIAMGLLTQGMVGKVLSQTEPPWTRWLSTWPLQTQAFSHCSIGPCRLCSVFRSRVSLVRLLRASGLWRRSEKTKVKQEGQGAVHQGFSRSGILQIPLRLNARVGEASPWHQESSFFLGGGVGRSILQSGGLEETVSPGEMLFPWCGDLCLG